MNLGMRGLLQGGSEGRFDRCLTWRPDRCDLSRDFCVWMSGRTRAEEWEGFSGSCLTIFRRDPDHPRGGGGFRIILAPLHSGQGEAARDARETISRFRRGLRLYRITGATGGGEELWRGDRTGEDSQRDSGGRRLGRLRGPAVEGSTEETIVAGRTPGQDRWRPVSGKTIWCAHLPRLHRCSLSFLTRTTAVLRSWLVRIRRDGGGGRRG